MSDVNDLKKMAKIFLSDIGVVVHIGLVISAIIIAINFVGWISLLLLPVGWVSYVIQEHLVHRYIFHAPAPRNQVLFNLLYRVHYGHHDQIQNSELLFTPLWFSLPLGLLNVVAISILLPLPHAYVLVYGGAVTAYVLFEWCHLLSHFHAKKRGPIMLRLTRDHGRHHHINFHNWYTVSPGGQWVDAALGCSPTDFVRSENPQTCGLAPDDPRLLAARRKFGSNRVLANRA